ncbi:MAG: PH domain-containing protein [Alishewanella sp.]|nr:PH domain-containing protein [Alishewanella sp.]
MAEPQISVSEATPALDALSQWQRVSPIALLYLALRLFKAIFGNVSYLAPVLIVFYQGIQRQPRAFLLGVLVVLLLLIVVALLRYWAFRFRIIDETVEIRSGVLRKAQLNLPFNRIQNVRLQQPLYYRPTGHLCVHLDTAGSKVQEAQLAALPEHWAQQLQLAIYAKRQALATAAQPLECIDETATANTEAATAATDPTETLLCRRDIGDLVLYGISNNRVILALGLLAPFYRPLVDTLNEKLPVLGLDISGWFNPAQQSWFGVGLAVLATAMFFMLLITLGSIALSVISYYQFRLYRTQDRYIRRSGLFTRHEISMTLSRLQWVKLQQDWLDKLLGRCNLHYEQLFSPLEAMQQNAGHSKIMVPALHPDAAAQLLYAAYPQQQLAKMVLKGVNWRYLIPSALFVSLPLLVISLLLLIRTSVWMGSFGILLTAIVQVLLLMRWRKFGYALDTEFLYIRQGVIGADYYCVPLHKLQQLTLSQHWFMRKAQLQHLRCVYAAGALNIPYMPQADAQKLANYALYQAQASGKGWM